MAGALDLSLSLTRINYPSLLKLKKLPEFASNEDFVEFFETHDMGEYELEEYRFDYTKAKPNRFALRSPATPKRDRLEEDGGSDRDTGN